VIDSPRNAQPPSVAGQSANYSGATDGGSTRTRTAPPEPISEWDAAVPTVPGHYWAVPSDDRMRRYVQTAGLSSRPDLAVMVEVRGNSPEICNPERYIWHGPLAPPALPAGGRW
jgi:hypothetical protein